MFAVLLGNPDDSDAEASVPPRQYRPAEEGTPPKTAEAEEETLPEAAEEARAEEEKLPQLEDEAAAARAEEETHPCDEAVEAEDE